MLRGKPKWHFHMLTHCDRAESISRLCVWQCMWEERDSQKDKREI
jgi:hypothetical protein